MQRLGSWAVRIASGTDIPDAPSGFRAYHRNAAAQIYVYDTYTYTLDTIIQAGHKNIPISWAYVGLNPPLRPSRLMRSSLDYVVRSAFAVIRVFIIYKPLRFFTLIAALVALPGLIGLLRFLVFAALGDGGGHVQSLVISAALIVIAGIVQIGGLQADLTAANRRLLEDVRSRQILTRSNGELP
jgi:hypothetical protein